MLRRRRREAPEQLGDDKSGGEKHSGGRTGVVVARHKQPPPSLQQHHFEVLSDVGQGSGGAWGRRCYLIRKMRCDDQGEWCEWVGAAPVSSDTKRLRLIAQPTIVR